MTDIFVPPQSIEAEQSVLGVFIMESKCFGKVFLEPEDFYREQHRTIFRAMQELHRKHETIDIVTLSDHLKGRREMEKAGGLSYLSELAQSVMTSAGVEKHAKIVREKSIRRRVMVAARQLTADALTNEEATLEELYSKYKIILTELSRCGDNGQTMKMIEVARRVSAYIDKRYNNRHEISGIDTGYKALNLFLDGWQPGSFYVIGARPGHGKTALVLDSAQKSGVPVGMISIEMDELQLGVRVAATQSRVPLTRLLKGFLDKSDWPNINRALARMAEMPITLDFMSRNALDIERKAAKMVDDDGIQLLIVDYMQLVVGSEKKWNKKREEEVGEVSRLLKHLAKLHRIPVIGISSLNREVEGRADKRPMLKDLRESGQIEYDADVVILLFRSKERKDRAELILEKVRNGPTGVVHLGFDGEHMTYYDLDNLEGRQGSE
ncbi:MAG: replicative DNA helicase [Nitrospirae bacterium]|nr:replicative DNA helicase [Nitrospirota bacterium]MCL5238632.1 replicative DNA helicase [Nitrospirota bacterium]